MIKISYNTALIRIALFTFYSIPIAILIFAFLTNIDLNVLGKIFLIVTIIVLVAFNLYFNIFDYDLYIGNDKILLSGLLRDTKIYKKPINLLKVSSLGYATRLLDVYKIGINQKWYVIRIRPKEIVAERKKFHIRNDSRAERHIIEQYLKTHLQ